MPFSIAEILSQANAMKSKDDQVAVLHKHDNQALRLFLRAAFDPNVKWRWPEGGIDYKPSNLPDLEAAFRGEARRLYLFMGPPYGNPNLSDERCKVLLIQFLETIDPKDAELFASVMQGKMPYKKITRELVETTWPGLI